MTTMDTRSNIFESTRPLLFSIAYRMLGSVADAEDLVQDACLRWLEAPETEVRAPRAYLATIVTRLAINQLQSARSRRETYVGPWLPEPLVTEHAPDPSEPVELAESLSMAFLMMLERLSPTERAVLLLHDVFGYTFDEVATMVDSSPAACRQLASRTRRKLDHERETPLRPDRAREQQLVEQLLTTIASGNIDEVMHLLAPDVVLLSDAGAARHAARRPVVGPDRVARFLVNLSKRLLTKDVEMRPAHINGEPGLVFVEHGQPDYVLSFSFTPDGQARRLWSQLNPEKLRHLH
jgi:RNA polymerase sigma-70 factor, ECF subfamily